MKLKFVSGLIQIASLRFIEALEGSKITLTIDRISEKRSQMFDRRNSIFVKSIRSLTEVKETEKFMYASLVNAAFKSCNN